MAEGSHHSQSSGSRIEVVEWQDNESSIGQKSGCSSDSLSQLMVGPSASDVKADEKLTIDNLWKILACEKPGEAHKTSSALTQADSARKENRRASELAFKSPLASKGETGSSS